MNGVSGKWFSEQMNTGYHPDPKLKDSAKEGFSKNLKGMADQKPEEETGEIQEIADKKSYSQIGYYYGKTATELIVQRNGSVKMDAVMECGVRYITQSESDCVKSFLAEGYTLKAQVAVCAHRVYIEQKWEDGTYQAYEVNPLKISEDTEDPIEKMAIEAWQKARELFNDGMVTEYNPGKNEEGETEEDIGIITFTKMLEEFHEFVKKRLKEGPPKIQIGGAEFSEEEWEKLMKRIDREIDAYKAELRERIRKDQEKEPISPPSGSAVETKSLAETAGVEPESEGAEEEAVSENEALEGSASPQRGNGFLARLMGEKKAPYSYLADESGVIVYNGVTFICNDKKQQICLGDMTDSKNVLTIPLSKGGSLKVNRDNLGELAKAIGMFSPEDVERILRAIARDNKAREMEMEIEDMKHKGI